MDKITSIFDKLDLKALVPEMDKLLSDIQSVASILVIVGPVVMLLLGLWYFFLPPKEANHHVGFRTYFGMGSVEAWKLTQKIAGISIGSVGLVLTVIMGIISLGYKGKDVMLVMESATRCLIWQAVLAVVVYLGVSVAAAVLFDKKGDRRQFKK